ncbi:hypothetical protein E2P81_ATG11036 [Venturia nashicola]|uniref:DUF8021 domain-containing protein n=1 Tax=Venturia nashicola TaxID=86259 RepID=A0A4Z1PB01_9PEZI|nr:hypothetical protein E6O75_ATG10712 [Venturia nashicola]TLD27748.1 hypothetical protein E2P81_ATG11036 [Venturia nashicola]
MHLLSVLTAFTIHASLNSAACTRDLLQKSLDSFTAKFNGAGSAPTVAPNVKISQNNILLTSLNSSAWANTTSLYSAFKIIAIDTEICSIARFMLGKQKSENGTEAPAIMSVRIKTTETGEWTELEILNALKGSHAFFKPDAYSNPAPPLWSTPIAGNLSRSELQRIANLYPSGIQAGDGSAIPQGDTCPRIENGVQTTTTCTKGLIAFKQIVRERRWVADTVSGVVLGAFYFDKPASRGLTYGLWLNEYFKIEGGKMVGIQAAMKELGGVPFKDVWGDGTGTG